MSQVLVTDIAVTTGSVRSISDKLTMVDAKNLPLSSMIKKGRQDMLNQKHEWVMLKNMEPRRTAKIDGAPAGAAGNAFDGNYDSAANFMQWFEEVGGVGMLAQIGQNMTGIPNKLAKATAMFILRMKRNWEISISSDDAPVPPSGAVAGVSRGMGDLLSSGAQAVLPVPASFRPPAGSVISTASASITEPIIQNWLQSSYNVSGKKQTFSCVAGQAFINAFRGFYGTATASTNVMSTIRSFTQPLNGTIYNDVEVYKGSWGTLELIPSLFNAYYTGANALQPLVSQARAYAVTPESWEWVGQLAPQNKDLPYDGGGDRFQLNMVGCLACTSPLDQLMSNAAS